MGEKVCLINREAYLGNKDGRCISIENCAHKADVYKFYDLDLEKVNTVDDCKKILKFLCQTTIKPLPSDLEYGGFSAVSEYFKTIET